MKLVDFITELEKKKSTLPNSEEMEKIAGGNGFLLDHKSLKNFEKKLFECDEFKNVVRINFIELPNYLVEEETGEPIATNREFLGGNTKLNTVSLFQVNPNQELKFNKIVDLYSIRLNKRFTTKEDIVKPGVWVYPTDYDQQTFAAKNQIRVIWDPAQLNEALKMVGNETSKERLMKMFECALDSMEPNIPCEYVLTLRCSARSIANADEIKVVEPVVAAAEVPVISMDFPPIS